MFEPQHHVLTCVPAVLVHPAGMGACVSLNIMWLHAEQASFKMSTQQYQEKLDSVAALVNVLGQTDKVGGVLSKPSSVLSSTN
jgi:hypothetical protein